jgi:hypothetical protein
MRTSDIARICHEANRAYCLALGDTSQQPWEAAPKWQRDSAIAGVAFLLDRSAAGPADSHKSWFDQKKHDGWRYGPTKDEDAKTHPCMVDYMDLPMAQRAKDRLFCSIVRAMEPRAGQPAIERDDRAEAA